jgi:hypothetical protein
VICASNAAMRPTVRTKGAWNNWGDGLETQRNMRARRKWTTGIAADLGIVSQRAERAARILSLRNNSRRFGALRAYGA